MIRILILATLVFIFGTGSSFARVHKVETSGQATLNKLASASCDERAVQELYNGEYGLVVDDFVNVGNIPVYLWSSFFVMDSKLGVNGDNLCLVNRSEYKENDYRFLNFNKTFLSGLGWKINPGQRVRHLTTAQEYGQGWEFGDWNLEEGITTSSAPGSMHFTKGNVRNPIGNVPNTVSQGESYDCRIKIGTVYDTDDNASTINNNSMIVECMDFQIRWCGDGLYQPKYGEQCDDGNNIDGDGCDKTCKIEIEDPIEPEQPDLPQQPEVEQPQDEEDQPQTPQNPEQPEDNDQTPEGEEENDVPELPQEPESPTSGGDSDDGNNQESGDSSDDGGSNNGDDDITGSSNPDSDNEQEDLLHGSAPEIFGTHDLKCEYIDPPSVQEGEYLPIWWKLKSGIWTNNCTFLSQGKYQISTARCKFEIENGKGEIVRFEKGCFENDWSTLGNDFLADNNIVQSYNGRTLFKVEGFNNYGEFKIKLNGVDAKVCDQGEFKSGGYLGNVCEMNFVYTKPLFYQKGLFFSTLGSSDYGDYYYINGDKVFNFEDDKTNITNYSGSTNLEFIMSEFVEKNVKLAKSHASLPEIGLLSNIKKVSNQNIYVVDANGGVIDVPSNSRLEGSTIIVVDGDIRINGSLYGNSMFVVPDGKIVLNNTDCDSIQTIEGVFLTKQFDGKVMSNQDLNKNWCNDGRIKINGILSGQGVDNLVKMSRSNFDIFFNSTYSDLEKLEYGAALFSNNNVSNWLTLPPGAKGILNRLEIKN